MVLARKLVSALEVTARVFGAYIKPNPLNYPTGREILSKPLETAIKTHYAIPALSYGRLRLPWRFMQKQENQFWKTFRRERKGMFRTKKGQGKKAQKRAKEAAKAQAKAVKK